MEREKDSEGAVEIISQAPVPPCGSSENLKWGHKEAPESWPMGAGARGRDRGQDRCSGLITVSG